MSTLNLFVTSVRPDPYINVIAYCLDHRGVDDIRFIAVAGHGYPEQRSKALALTVLTNVRRQLDALGQGDYLVFESDAGLRQIKLSKEAASYDYGRLQDRLERECKVSTEVIRHSSLDERLRELSMDKDALYDVTALKKSLLVDVTSIMISLGVSGVHTFELLRPPRHDDTDLYHDLKAGTDFEYRDLTASAPVNGAMKRITRATRRARAALVVTATVVAFAGVIAFLVGLEPIFGIASLVGAATGIAGLLISMKSD